MIDQLWPGLTFYNRLLAGSDDQRRPSPSEFERYQSDLREEKEAGVLVNAALATLELHDRRTLVVGSCGVGKTASVLEAAARYCQSEPGLDLCRIPVLLNAASWRSGIPIDEWVVDNLHGLYGTPKKVSRALIAAQGIWAILDDLEAVPEACRGEFVSAVNFFMKVHPDISTTILCTEAMAETHGNSLEVDCTVLVRPLDDDQAEAYLRPLGNSLHDVRAVPDGTARVEGVPLVLDLVALAKRSSNSLSKLPQTAQEAADQYVRSAVEKSYGQGPAGLAFRRYLGWIAEQMQRTGQWVFEVDRPSPSLLQARGPRRTYRLVVSAVSTAIGIMIGLPLGWITHEVVRTSGLTGLVERDPLLNRWLGMWLAVTVAYALSEALLARLGVGAEVGTWQLNSTVAKYLSPALRKKAVPRLALTAGVAPLLVGIYRLVGWLTPAVLLGIAFGVAGSVSSRLGSIDSLWWSWRSFARKIVPRLVVSVAMGIAVAVFAAIEVGFLIAMYAGLAVGVTGGLVAGFKRRVTMLDEPAFQTRAFWSKTARMISEWAALGLIVAVSYGLLLGYAAQVSGLDGGIRLGLVGGFVGACASFLLASAVAILHYDGLSLVRIRTMQWLLADGPSASDRQQMLSDAVDLHLLVGFGSGYVFTHGVIAESCRRWRSVDRYV